MGLLEDGENGPPSDPIEANPQTIARVLRLEQVEEHIHQGRMSQVRADNLVSLDERPAVGMKLGGGYVELGQELPLKVCEGKPKLDLLEHSGIDKAERGVVAPLIIGADGLTGRTRAHRHFVIVLFAEREVILITFLAVSYTHLTLPTNREV